ncbi:type II toxin-antitoxin system RelE/ParE family toxin [Thermodesulfobacteriota bacterium B35]
MIIKDVVVLQDAEDDLVAGRTFYDQRGAGIGEYFWDSLIADIRSLFVFAGIHSRRYGLYRMLAKRFPYAIYYDIKDEVARVIAILPLRRDPV